MIKAIIQLAIIPVVLSSINAQYNYGIDICSQDMRIAGLLNIGTDTNSVYIGFESGINANSIESKNNTAVGYLSGKSISSGDNNTFLGSMTGTLHSSGTHNTYIGSLAGSNNSFGISNTFIGSWAGRKKTSGSGNTFVGQFSGHNNFSGSGNIFIGQSSGSNEMGSNRLYVENSSISTPLIYGEFDNDLIQINGDLNITDVLNLKPQSPPSGSCTNKGDLIYGTDDELYICKGVTWKQVLTN